MTMWFWGWVAGALFGSWVVGAPLLWRITRERAAAWKVINAARRFDLEVSSLLASKLPDAALRELVNVRRALSGVRLRAMGRIDN